MAISEDIGADNDIVPNDPLCREATAIDFGFHLFNHDPFPVFSPRWQLPIGQGVFAQS
jgi:hypothetical protein